MERDLRFRTHAGALTHFYLDAMLGLVAIHTHGGQPAVRREHESLLTEWARAGLNLQRAVLSLETVQFLAGFGLAIWLLASHLGRGDAGAVLLLVYWALNLPALGQEVALIAWQYPSYRNVTLRLLEPLGALEQRAPGLVADLHAGGAFAVAFENVSVVAAGHQVLRDINLAIAPGTHVAIVGPSGAGKSSLVGLLLGWYRAASGSVLVDGLEVDDSRLDQLRPRIAWLDPAVQLWNRPLAENLQYGSGASIDTSARERHRSGRIRHNHRASSRTASTLRSAKAAVWSPAAKANAFAWAAPCFVPMFASPFLTSRFAVSILISATSC